MKINISKTINSLANRWGIKTPRSKAGKVGYWFLMQLVVLLPEFLIALPLIILLTAWNINQNGIAMGDADGTPGSFNWLLAIVGLLTAIAVAFIQWWIIAVLRKGRQK